MPSTGWGSYENTGSGTNSQACSSTIPLLPAANRRRTLASQGNHYCNRDYGSDSANSNSYHYSNRQAILFNPSIAHRC
jgi:hypothetical protein